MVSMYVNWLFLRRPLPPDQLATLIDQASESNITIAILTQVIRFLTLTFFKTSNLCDDFSFDIFVVCVFVRRLWCT